MVILAVDSLRVALQVYCPALDVTISLSVRSLEVICPLVVGAAGVGVTPGPSHWKSGVPVTPVGRVTEQVRVTVSPAMMVEEGEEVREMMIDSVGRISMSEIYGWRSRNYIIVPVVTV